MRTRHIRIFFRTYAKYAKIIRSIFAGFEYAWQPLIQMSLRLTHVAKGLSYSSENLIRILLPKVPTLARTPPPSTCLIRAPAWTQDVLGFDTTALGVACCWCVGGQASRALRAGRRPRTERL